MSKPTVILYLMWSGLLIFIGFSAIKSIIAPHNSIGSSLDNLHRTIDETEIVK